MDIDSRQTFLLLALLPMFLSSMAAESNVAESVRSEVHFPRVVGDPARVDPFSALIRLSGERSPGSRFNMGGRWHLKNPVGPFSDIDIWMDERRRPIQLLHEVFTEGGIVTQAVARAIHRETSFGAAVNRIKDLQIALLREGGVQRLDEVHSANNTYVVSNEKAMRGGWRVTISVHKVNEDKYEYLLVFRRRINRKADRAGDVVVEIDI